MNYKKLYEKQKELTELVENRQDITPERYLDVYEDLTNEISTLESDQSSVTAEEILDKYPSFEYGANTVRVFIKSDIINAMEEYSALCQPKGELYENVYIKSEDDLPKESGRYFVQKRNGEKDVWERNPGDFDNLDWKKRIDWYLKPL
jgi:hypothetical protein